MYGDYNVKYMTVCEDDGLRNTGETHSSLRLFVFDFSPRNFGEVFG
jgi:hypothetical protein